MRPSVFDVMGLLTVAGGIWRSGTLAAACAGIAFSGVAFAQSPDQENVSENIGKLVGNGVTEVSRHLPANSAGGTFLGKSTGSPVRGLTGVITLLNDRDSYGVSGGRNLAWEEVPQELTQGIDVFKSPSAAIGESGFGGVFNLRTSLPFDFGNRTVRATLTGNYADRSGKIHAGGVGLVGNSWDTRVGKIGLLFNFAYTGHSAGTDEVRVQPYAPVVDNAAYIQNNPFSTPSLGDIGSELVFIPGEIDFSRRKEDGTRRGLYAAAQWQPDEEFLFSLTAFNSRYGTNATTYEMSFGPDVQKFIAPGSINTFDEDGNLVRTSGLAAFSWGYRQVPSSLKTQYTQAVDSTTDISLVGEWHPSAGFGARLALQYVPSSARQNDDAASLSVFLPGYGLTLPRYGSSKLPEWTAPDDATDIADPADFIWEATMPHRMQNHGGEIASYFDANLAIGDTGLIRTLDFGLKLTATSERDDETTWNYRELSPWYVSPNHVLSENSSYGTSIDLSRLVGGTVGLPSVMWFPSSAAVRDPLNLQSLYNSTAETGISALAEFNPGTLARMNETSLTGYASVDFAGSGFFIPFDGNLGVRVVAYRYSASGYRWSPALDMYVDADNAVYLHAQGVPQLVKGDYSAIDALPSLNVRFVPTPETNIRVAVSLGVNRPTFAEINPRGYLTGSYNGSYVSYLSGNWGTADLKPEIVEQADASIERTFLRRGMVRISGFWKNIRNVISTRQSEFPEVFDASILSGDIEKSAHCDSSAGKARCTVPASVTEYYNETKASRIAGFEIGLQGYADFLSAPYDGLGIDFNYTYIDSTQPGAEVHDLVPGSTDMLTNGRKITGVPVTGMSKNTVYIAGVYDKRPLSVRVVYNWRDQFLISTAAWQAAGTYNNVTAINYGMALQGQIVTYALPVYQYPLGTLDASVSLALGENTDWTLEATNLTRSIVRQYMFEGATERGGMRLLNRSWSMTDTRYTMLLRLKL